LPEQEYTQNVLNSYINLPIIREQEQGHSILNGCQCSSPAANLLCGRAFLRLFPAGNGLYQQPPSPLRPRGTRLLYHAPGKDDFMRREVFIIVTATRLYSLSSIISPFGDEHLLNCRLPV